MMMVLSEEKGMKQISAAPEDRAAILADQLALDLLDVRRAADIAYFEVHIRSFKTTFTSTALLPATR
jgi:hypothetical protein